VIFVTFLTKLSGFTPVTHLEWIPIFEWCIVKCGSKNRHQKDMCLKEIGKHIQNLLTILDLIVSIIGGLCDQGMAPWLSPFDLHIDLGRPWAGSKFLCD
jgi:hypothetical protein